MVGRKTQPQCLLVLVISLFLAMIQLATGQGAYDGAVRLFGGKSHNEGHVEFYYRGTWGAVCDSTWDITDGNVVCQQLGFPGAKMATLNSFFPIRNDGSNIVTLNGTHCSGSEPSLALCVGSSWGAGGCNSSHYAGVVCKDPLDYSLRLSVTQKEYRGNLEVSLSGEWLRVLADEYWDLTAADFICSELGFQYATSAGPAPRVVVGGDANPDRWNFTTLRCWESEGNKTCNRSGGGNSAPVEARPLEIQCNAFDLTLGRHSNLLANTANLILLNNTKVRDPARSVICDTEWSLVDATVACRQLGFAGAEEASQQRHRLASNKVYKLLSPVCHGDEASLDQCGRNVWRREPCMSRTSAAVRCISPTVTVASVTHINASAIRIKWTSDNLPKARIITGYTLKYTATATDSTFVAETAGLVDHVVLSDLMPYTEYTVMIRMRTEHGEGKWSNTSQFITLSSAPEVLPNILKISSPSSKSIAITVKPASEYSQINGRFQGYTVEYETPGSQEHAVRLPFKLNDTVITISGLHAFAEYAVRLAVWNDAGDGPFTSTFTVTTQEDVPSSVPSFNVTAISPTSVALRWEEPEFPNGIITSFVCQYISVTKGIRHEGEKIFGGTAREGVLTNLEEFVEYKLIMYATTIKGQGEGSKEEFVTTLPAAPTEPLSPDAKQVNSTAILLSWEPPPLAGQNGPNISYTVEYGWSGQIQAVLHTTSTSILIGGLSPYIPYEFKIAAVSAANKTGTFTDLFSGNITRTPSPVRKLTLSNDQGHSCWLTWTAPQWINGDFKSYSIKLNGDVVDHAVSDSTLDTYYDCKELEEGTHYEGSIVAVNEHGEGKPSYINFTTSIARPVASPTFVKFNNVSSTGLTVSWQPPPIRDQNGPITSYKIRYHTTGSSRIKYVTEMLSVDPNLSLNASWRFNYTVVKLVESTEYSVAVAAENEQGEGPYSSDMVIRLLAPPSTPATSFEAITVAVIMVVLILAIAVIIAATSLYLCIKWKQLKSHFEHHFQSKNSKGSHIYEEPKCSSANRGASIENIYDVCGTPGRLSMHEEDYPERSGTDEPTLSATNMLFADHTGSATCTGDDAHSLAAIPEPYLGHSETPEFLDNPLYQSLHGDLTCADEPAEDHSTAGRLVSSDSHGVSARSRCSTIPRQKSSHHSPTMAFSEPVTMSHLEQQEQHYDRLAPYRHQPPPGEPHSAPSTMSSGIFLSASAHYAQPRDRVIYQNTSELSPLQEGKRSSSVEEMDYVHIYDSPRKGRDIYDAPRKGRDIYAVPRSCIATISSDETGAKSSGGSAGVHDPNSDQCP